MMKAFGPPITQANSAVLFFSKISKTKPNLEQQLYPRNNASSSSPVLMALKKPIKRVPKQQSQKHNPPLGCDSEAERAGAGAAPIERRGTDGNRNDWVILGAVTVGVAALVMGFGEQKALAFGPEGPLVEEFWDNMRRYALYALTVSTGALYIVFQPILELLKNPISAILILAIAGAAFFLVSQVLSAMVGVSDFTYDYGY